jgi:hypothetical protein
MASRSRQEFLGPKHFGGNPELLGTAAEKSKSGILKLTPAIYCFG